MRGLRAIQTAALLSAFSSAVSMTHIFVYGTLKKGQPNHFRMMAPANGTAEYCGRTHTLERFPLVIAGPHNIPYLLNAPGTGHRVQGEVYRVDQQMLAFLDDFEGCPSHYQRTSVRLEVEEWAGLAGLTPGPPPAEGSVMETFTYSTSTYPPEWSSLPTYDSYDAYGSHGLAYVCRESRD